MGRTVVRRGRFNKFRRKQRFPFLRNQQVGLIGLITDSERGPVEIDPWGSTYVCAGTTWADGISPKCDVRAAAP